MLLKGVLWIFKKIYEQAKIEMEDTPEKLKKELLDIQMLLETGEISEKEYQKKEENILKRLSALTKNKK